MWVVTTKLVGSPILVVVEHPSMNYEPMIIHAATESGHYGAGSTLFEPKQIWHKKNISAGPPLGGATRLRGCAACQCPGSALVSQS